MVESIRGMLSPYKEQLRDSVYQTRISQVVQRLPYKSSIEKGSQSLQRIVQKGV